MRYFDTYQNMKVLFRSFGYIDAELLKQFFSDAPDFATYDKTIERLRAEGFLIPDSSDDSILRMTRYPELDPIIKSLTLAAFEIPAGLGSTKIYNIHAIEYPGLFVIMTTDNTCIDYWYIPNEAFAKTVYLQYAEIGGEDLIDKAEHYAITNDQNLGKKLDLYGFAGYYTFCQTKLVLHKF